MGPGVQVLTFPTVPPSATRYQRRYLRDDTFDNVYITRRFVELDLRCAEQGKPTVLPLSARERGRYIPPGQSHPPRVSPSLALSPLT